MGFYCTSKSLHQQHFDLENSVEFFDFIFLPKVNVCASWKRFFSSNLFRGSSNEFISNVGSFSLQIDWISFHKFSSWKMESLPPNFSCCNRTFRSKPLFFLSTNFCRNSNLCRHNRFLVWCPHRIADKPKSLICNLEK